MLPPWQAPRCQDFCKAVLVPSSCQEPCGCKRSASFALPVLLSEAGILSSPLFSQPGRPGKELHTDPLAPTLCCWAWGDRDRPHGTGHT